MKPTGAAADTTKAGFTLHGQTIGWHCSGCRHPIAVGEGHLCCEWTTAIRQHEEWTQWESAHFRDRWQAIPLSEYPRLPVVQWLAWHHGCDPHPDRNDYWIRVERIDTLARLVHWAGHLMSKGWINQTNWHELMMRIGEDA